MHDKLRRTFALVTRRAAAAGTVAWLVLLSLLPGCESPTAVQPRPVTPAVAASEKRPKLPFETFRVYAEPNAQSSTAPSAEDAGRVLQAIKPGHWVSALVETKANLFDFSGTLRTLAVDSQQRPLTLDRNRHYLMTARDATLPKGQRKSFETLLYPPRTEHLSTIMSNRLEGRLDGAENPVFGEILSHMPSYQYFLVVLARDPLRYQGLKVLESIRPLREFMPPNPEDAAYYRLVAPQVDQPLALPRSALCWTSTAYVLWDGAPAAALSPEQQQALVDWLHWGGGLIISGPESLEALRGTFLAPWLPTVSAASRSLGTAELAELNRQWTITDVNGRRDELRPAAPWSGLSLQLHRHGEFVTGTGGLVAERRAGRGRVLVTAFRLAQPELLAWPSYDSFFNAVLLGRPPRVFDAARGQFEYSSGDSLDPAFVTSVRYFTRDASSPDPRRPDAEAFLTDEDSEEAALARSPPSQFDPAELFKTRSGVAAWNDFSWVSRLARQALRRAAGISVPDRRFVMSILGVYLLAIVPLNWLVFRLLGHVEWAWFAVPALAAGWGVAVVWMAQLDIGFARAETELGVLELQPGYQRGHLTRYTAVYTSLSTTYEARFGDRAALAQPMATGAAKLPDEAESPATLSDAEDRRLTGLVVTSNSTGLIHSEETCTLSGGLEWEPSAPAPSVMNRTELSLRDILVVRRRLDEEDRIVVERARLDSLRPREAQPLKFAALDPASREMQEDEVVRGMRLAQESLDLRPLAATAADADSLHPGDVRLVARLDGALPGMRIEPAVAQPQRATLVVAHLAYGPRTAPRADFHLRTSPAASDQPDAGRTEAAEGDSPRSASPAGSPERGESAP